MKIYLKESAVLSVLVLALCLSQTAYAGDFKKGGAHNKGMTERQEEKMDNLMSGLDLTQAQKEQIARRRDAQNEKRKGLMEKLRASRKELKEKLEKYDSEKSGIYKTVGEINEIQGTLLEQRVEDILSIKEILTPLQFKELNEKMNKRRDKAQKTKKGRNGGRSYNGQRGFKGKRF